MQPIGQIDQLCELVLLVGDQPHHPCAFACRGVEQQAALGERDRLRQERSPVRVAQRDRAHQRQVGVGGDDARADVQRREQIARRDHDVTAGRAVVPEQRYQLGYPGVKETLAT